MAAHIEVSIGPVQGFVAESRRTRDLWGSSYLLSYLTGHAMHGAVSAGGTIVRPTVENDPVFAFIADKAENHAPTVGSLPNHFVVEADGDQVQGIVLDARKAFQDAWRQVCEAVWAEFVQPVVSNGNGSAEIWDRQVTGFWEFQWVVGQPGQHGLLERRKMWRTHQLPEEPGDKCAVMPELQELSGYVRSRSTNVAARQDAFWSAVRERVGPLDLRDNERLSAVALVKRLYPTSAACKKAIGAQIPRWHWPSTVYVAAVPWIRCVISRAPHEAAEYAQALRKAATEQVFYAKPRFSGLTEHGSGEFARLDGNYYHQDFVAIPRLCPLDDDPPDEMTQPGPSRQRLQQQLKELADLERVPSDNDGPPERIGSPSKFYALMLADGDRLGRIVREAEDVGQVSAALATFTAGVESLVHEQDGVTIYAGGDDLMAMLPVDHALACASAVRDAYRDAFAEALPDVQATLSAAVVFAHVRVPLSSVLQSARTLLDEIAKRRNGRNSIAATVLLRGGAHCRWVSTWERDDLPEDAHGKAVGGIHALRDRLAGYNEPGLSSSMVYRLRESLGVLCDWPAWRPGVEGTLPPGIDLNAFLAADIARTLEQVEGDAPASEDVEALASLTCGLIRRSSAETLEVGSSSAVSLDSLLLARFLATRGIGEEFS